MNVIWQKEQRGERTLASGRKREIKARNKERARQRELEMERDLDIELLW